MASITSRRTLQRKLALWTKDGGVFAKGVRKGTRYFVTERAHRQVIGTGHLIAQTPAVRGTADVALPLSAEGQRIRTLVRRPLVDREPVGYQRAFLERYEPNVTFYLPDIVRRQLDELGRTPEAARPAGTYARRILERLLIDLSWNSSRLEGNTYSLLETRDLIRDNAAAPGKDPKETQMILNHKAAIELLVDSPLEVGVNRYTVQNLHALLADNLLDDPAGAGRLRHGPVAITQSSYVPTGIPQLLEEMFDLLLGKAAAIQDPMEQSFFLLVHLPYLQPFVDVNKRTSRLAANVPLIQANRVPLSFVDVPESDYMDGLIGVYELNRVELLRDVFAWAYERSCRQYKTIRDSLPEPDPFRLRYRSALIDVVAEAVRDKRMPTTEQIRPLAAKLVAEGDLARFVTIAVAELAGLHEGNIARFRIRPGELHAWRAVQ
ncbi:MAG: Fic family protein, partial [Steroidobacteraceae bacterium]